MDNDLQFSSGLPLVFLPGLPTGYAGAILPGGGVCSASGDFGYWIRQEITHRQFCLRYQVMRFFERRQWCARLDPPGLLLRLALRQTMVHQFANSGKTRIPEKYFALFYGKQTESIATFAPGKEYQWIDIAYAPALINELLRVFPKLAAFLQPPPEKRQGPLLTPPRPATDAMLRVIQTILSASEEQRREKDRLENKVKDILLMSLEQARGNAGQTWTMNPEEKACIEKARRLIEQNIRRHYSTVELAQRVQLNEFTFKIGFRQATGVGTFEYLLQRRLNKAHDLLIHTDLPIKVIPEQVGYESLTGFITGFKKYFGYTPGSLRR